MQPLIVVRGVARITAASAFAWLFFTVSHALAGMAAHASLSPTKYFLLIPAAAVVALSGFDDLSRIFTRRNQLIFYLGALAAIAGLLYLGRHSAGLGLSKIAAPVLAILIAAIVVRASKPVSNIVNMVAGLVSASLLFFGMTYEGHFASRAISLAIFVLAGAGLLSAILTAAQRNQPNSATARDPEIDLPRNPHR
ncbi:MAG: hypothetical protein ABI383_00655 [Acidobacteriaceae bacterium]